MHGRSNDPPQQWSVHAQFTISHPGIDDPNASQEAHAERDENAVRMSYSWTSQANSQEPHATTTDSASGNCKTESVPSGYGFQRGNLLFTSVPPPKRSFGTINPDPHLLKVARSVEDSGYNSTLLSPNSCVSNRRTLHPYNHKCRSTCSIILSTTINEQPELEDSVDCIAEQQHCGRTQSLRCQTPSVKTDRPTNFYGCGDPWCYHSTYSDIGPISPTLGSETSCSTGQTVLHRPVSEVKKLDRCKDASVQTYEMVDKCTSPFPSTFNLKQQESSDEIFTKEKTPKKRYSYNSRSRTEPIDMRQSSPSSFTPDSLENCQPRKRLVRTPLKSYGKSPITSNTKTSFTESKSSDSTKKPRTVHIDVYCTGTEQESEETNSSSDIESKNASSPQTVFESEKVHITHSRSHEKNLPMKLKELASLQTDIKTSPPKLSNVKPENDSDDDNTSTAYPSQISSYSAIGGLSSFSSSIPPSWSTVSMSNDNDYDSVANTSWKDTFSDLDSVNRSRSSIALTDSLDFVPRRLSTPHKSDSIDEHPEIESKKISTPSTISLNPSDSFEYENSEDRIRIKRMEQAWNKPVVTRLWKSPQLERKHLLQQQKLKEYVENRLKNITLPKSESRESDSESDSSEKGWSFIKSDKKQKSANMKDQAKISYKPVPIKDEQIKQKELNVPVSIASRRSPTLRSPSVMALQAKLTLNPTLRSPFMIVPGIFTDQRSVAKKFGSIIDVFKKPGHHIGPAKNPECQCDHCKSYFEQCGRGRTRSFGETSSQLPWLNWRKGSRRSQPREPKDS